MTKDLRFPIAGPFFMDPRLLIDARLPMRGGLRNQLLEDTCVGFVSNDPLRARDDLCGTDHCDDTHGTGCVLSAAITAQLAQGIDLLTAVRRAKHFISSAIQSGPGLGHGRGPVNFLGP